ncbi:MAG: arginine--tRNA ligase [Actinomycetota bacterium]
MVQDDLIRALSAAAEAAAAELGADPAGLPAPELLRPRQKDHGDWSTNLALALAPRLNRPPHDVAEAIARKLETGSLIEGVEVAGPGFINLFLGSGWLHATLREVLERGPEYGRTDVLSGIRAQVEFVSANPTGPLHVGHARNAALGDAIANLLEAAGAKVEREYYYNDAGRQMELFAQSVEARYLESLGRPDVFPDEGYHGEYIRDIAAAIVDRYGESLADLVPEERILAVRDEAVAEVFRWNRATLERFAVRFDTWFLQSGLEESGAVDDAVRRLREAGHAYDADGAVWFRSTNFGDDKDRVLIRSNGTPTYFAADCAYVVDKFGRGFERLIYVWGADHHGDVVRVKGAAEALGYDPDAVEIVIYQFVSFTRGGEPVQMSKRTGAMISLAELLDEVGPDAARYTLLMRSNDAAIEFDIEEVKRQSLENPVYCVQYAHARIASLVRVAEEKGTTLIPWRDADLSRLTHESELALLRKLAELPAVVEAAAQGRVPHRLARYTEDTAAAFHRFYTDCRIIGDDPALTQARLWLSAGTKQVVGTALAVLGVSAPESMERIGDTDAEGSPDRG